MEKPPFDVEEAKRVIAQLVTDPTFWEDIQQAEAELEAGRGVRYRVVNGELVEVDRHDTE